MALGSQLLIACSGPGAMQAIVRAERVGWALLVLSLLLVAAPPLRALMRGHAVGRSVWALLVVLIHPGWWLSARGGDCGAMRMLGSIGMTVVAALVCSALLWRSARQSAAVASQDGGSSASDSGD